MSTARKPKASIPDEHRESLEKWRKAIRAGKFKRIAEVLSEGEGFTITVASGANIDLIKKKGRLTARLSDGEPPKMFVG